MKFPLSKVLVVGVAAFGIAVAANAADFINVLTGGTSGVYYPMGVALSQIYGKASRTRKVSVQATKASAENLNLLQAGKRRSRLHARRRAVRRLEGRRGRRFRDAAEEAARHRRHLPELHPDRRQRRFGHQDPGRPQGQASFGRRAQVGYRAQRSRRAQGRGTKLQGLGQGRVPAFGESVELMKNRQLDVTLQSAGLGVSALRDLAASMKIVVVEIPADVVAKIGDPAYLPADHPGQDLRRPGQGRAGDRDPELPRDARRRLGRHGLKITKSMWENLDALVAAHAAGKAIKKENAMKGMPVPLHPGAEKYYKEVGLLKYSAAAATDSERAPSPRPGGDCRGPSAGPSSRSTDCSAGSAARRSPSSLPRRCFLGLPTDHRGVLAAVEPDHALAPRRLPAAAGVRALSNGKRGADDARAAGSTGCSRCSASRWASTNGCSRLR